MKQTINEWDFLGAFKDWETYKDNFSDNGLRALYEYLTQYEESTGKELELDVVSICCEFTEYSSAIEAVKEYNGAVEENKDFDEDDKEKAALAWLEDQATVIQFDGGVIVQNF